MDAALASRKIIHVDMDAFYASVEQLDDPSLRNKPIAVGGGGSRGVVAAASYEARKYGVRSAMSGIIAQRNCPHLIFVKPRFERYKAVSQRSIVPGRGRKCCSRTFEPTLQPFAVTLWPV